MAELRQRAGNHNPIKARERAADILLMTFDEAIHRRSLDRYSLPLTIDAQTCLVPAMPGWVFKDKRHEHYR
jgi:hypothetical protein